MVAISKKDTLLKNGKHIVLRSADPTEAGAVLSFMRQMISESWRNMNSPPSFYDKTPEADYQKRLQEFCNDPEAFLFYAFDGTTVVGNFGFRSEGAPFLSRCATFGMSVLSEWQGQGLGRQILEYGLLNAKNLGKTNITLHVRTFNTGAIALYESLGFRRVGILEKYAQYEGEFFDEYIYQKIL